MVVDDIRTIVVAFLVAAVDRWRAGVQRGKDNLGMAFFLGDCAERHFDRRGYSDSDYRTVRVAQGLSQNILAFVSVGIVILLGILIYSEVDKALPSPDNTDLSNASSNATSTFGDSMELAPLVILVGVAGLVLAVVQRFR